MSGFGKYRSSEKVSSLVLSMDQAYEQASQEIAKVLTISTFAVTVSLIFIPLTVDRPHVPHYYWFVARLVGLALPENPWPSIVQSLLARVVGVETVLEQQVAVAVVVVFDPVERP